MERYGINPVMESFGHRAFEKDAFCCAHLEEKMSHWNLQNRLFSSSL